MNLARNHSLPTKLTLRGKFELNATVFKKNYSILSTKCFEQYGTAIDYNYLRSKLKFFYFLTRQPTSLLMRHLTDLPKNTWSKHLLTTQRSCFLLVSQVCQVEIKIDQLVVNFWTFKNYASLTSKSLINEFNFGKSDEHDRFPVDY